MSDALEDRQSEFRKRALLAIERACLQTGSRAAFLMERRVWSWHTEGIACEFPAVTLEVVRDDRNGHLDASLHAHSGGSRLPFDHVLLLEHVRFGRPYAAVTAGDDPDRYESAVTEIVDMYRRHVGDLWTTNQAELDRVEQEYLVVAEARAEP